VTATATLSDWLELLGLSEAFAGLFAGSERFTTLHSAIATARETYPGVSQDYISVLDLATRYVDEAQDVAREQAEAVADFNAAVVDAGYYFNYDSGRLLSSADRAEMQWIAEQVEDDLQAILDEIEDIEGEMESLQDDIEALEDDSAWDDLEAAEDDLEAATEELEDAAAALEAYE